VESSLRIARVRGIEIGVSWSWLVIAALVVWSLAAGLFPATYPDLSGGTHLVMALVTTVLFFASVLAHELGHALRAQREGVPIEGITLWLLGGVARLGGNPRSPGAAFRVSAVGPAITALLVLVFGGLALAGDRMDLTGSVQGVLDYLTRINLVLLVFNLVPALPLDGGRILQAWLWHRTGSFTGATVQAATAGRWFGYLLIFVGLLGLFGGTGLGGIWIAFIGWFLVQAAQAETSHALLRRSLGRLRVRDAMTPDPVTVEADLPVDRFTEQAWTARHSTYPVLDRGEVAGLVSVRAAAGVPPEQRASLRVADIMRPRDQVATVRGDRELVEVIEGFGHERGRILVLDDGHLAGVLAPSDVSRAVELGEARRAGRAGPGGPGAPGVAGAPGAPRAPGAAREPGEPGEPAELIEPWGERPVRRSTGIAVWLVVALAFLLVAGFLYHPPLVELSPGTARTIEDGIDIRGVPVTEIDGDYQLTGVRLDQPTALGALVAWIRPDRDVLPRGEVLPRDVDADRFVDEQRRLFTESRQMAAVAGARAAGLDVPVRGAGAEVVGVLPDSPADEALSTGDVIVAVDGRPVRTANELRTRLRSLNAGDEVTVTVAPGGDGDGEGAGAGGRRREVRVELAALPEVADGAGLGVQVTTRDLQVDLPFDVSFARQDVGGPSGGLAYALAISDMLDRADLAQGRRIAATGTIDVDGQVGAVGAVDLKAIAADDAGADLFLVPERDAADVDADDDLEVRAVRTLDEARDLLRTTT
jgi:PDZ domain-containing secreted protein/Zn-dependent protease/CBS domain-containing protein